MLDTGSGQSWYRRTGSSMRETSKRSGAAAGGAFAVPGPYLPPTAGAAGELEIPGFDLDAFLDFGAPAPATYTVQPGETLQAIAAKLHTTVDAIKAANADQLQSYQTRRGGTVQGFKAGAVIKVPAAAAPAPAPAPALPAPAAPAATTAPTSAPAEGGGFVDSLIGVLHDAWDFVTGANGAPAAAVDERPAGDTTSGTPAVAAPSAPEATPAPSAPAATPQPATAPLADLTDAERGARLSTFHADELGTIDKFGMSKTGRDAAKTRGEWLKAADIKKAGAGKSGEAFVDAVDALNESTNFSADQDQIIAAARDFAASPKALTAAQEAKAVINWGAAKLTLDGVSLNDDLKARLIKYVRFLAWAGLVTGPTKIGSVMRSPQSAHRLSVAWMFNLTANTSKGSTLHKADNRQKLVTTVTNNGGTDADGNKWLSDATVEGLKSRKDDDAALFEYIKSTAAPEANKVQVQGAIAAEGYKTADKRHPNVLGGSSVSNHLLGEAVDMYPPFVFNNLFDPMIDAIAMHFGLWRAVKDDSSSPEHWHYERLGSPPGAETDDAH